MALKPLKNVLKNVMADLVAEYVQEVTRVIVTPGEFEKFPDSDIVDTGRLRDSMIISSNPTTGDILADVEIEWNPKDPETGYFYAAAVYFGFFAYGGTKFISGRKWDIKALKNLNFIQTLADKLKAKGFKVESVTDNIQSLV